MPALGDDLTLTGLIAAAVLPFDADGRIDFDSYQGFLNRLIEAGVNGLAVNAEAGEGGSLWSSERRQVMRVAADAVGGRVSLVSGLMSGFTDLARRRAEEAANDGAEYLLVFPNTQLWGEPLDPDHVLAYLQAIHDASGLPQVIFQLLGAEYSQDALSAIIALPFVTAVKESTFDAYKYRTTLDLIRTSAPDVAVLTGNDNFIYESFLLGADGALLGSLSIATQEQVRLFALVAARQFDQAAQLSGAIDPLMRGLFKPPIRDYIARIKECLLDLAVFPTSKVRRPLTQLLHDESSEVRRLLHEMAMRVS